MVPKRQLSRLLLPISKIPNRNKISDKQFHLCGVKICLDKVTKSIHFQTNNKSPGNDGLTAEFYKPFANELSPVTPA